MRAPTFILQLTLLAALAPMPTRAQTTDAYRARQLFPVVVDTASFAQRFTFRAPNTVSLKFSYYPALETSGLASGKLDCGTQLVALTRSFASLREICPDLATGSQFGMLLVEQTDPVPYGFAGFSRVNNPQGNGFSVEAFGVEIFQGEYSSIPGYSSVTVDGLRRLAATPSSPAFQTNCFVGVAPGTISPVEPVMLNIKVSGGPTVTKSFYPGLLYRYLDVFAATGMAAGDVSNARLTISQYEEPLQSAYPIVAFCTVQDNSSFGADFRIGKSKPDGPLFDRLSLTSQEQMLPTGMTRRTFALGTGDRINTHVVYFRHPDRVSCSIRHPQTGVVLTQDYGLEMRMLEGDGLTVIAGGPDQAQFQFVYLGDKAARNGGANGRYLIEVQNNGFNTANSREYAIQCNSDSGHTQPELVRFQLSGHRF